MKVSNGVCLPSERKENNAYRLTKLKKIQSTYSYDGTNSPLSNTHIEMWKDQIRISALVYEIEDDMIICV